MKPKVQLFSFVISCVYLHSQILTMAKKILFTLLILSSFVSYSQKKKTEETSTKLPYDASTVSPISFRLVGPALTSGRIADIAIHPSNPDKWFIAAASGGVWTTNNHGNTFSPIFDGYGSYSIACVKIANSNHNTIWVGTGENNNQRSVSYGDGVYKSVDGGKSFTNMGLKNSEHIGNIIIHPTNENIVWVAAYGPLWSSGGERGIYKTVDGGKTWERVFFVSEDTGIAEIIMDPSNPDILYASAHQRRRHEWTYVGGGPESTVYKSTDGGKTWREISSGLPKRDMGRVGLAVSPVDANYVYAIVEARYGKAGFYRSSDKGESWSKMSDFNTSGNYYQEIFCDPKNRDKVFAMDTYLHHTEDGGKTFKQTGENNKHVDNHAIWIDPNNTNHWLVGCDGGLYETYSHAKEWFYFANLPIIQFYKVTTDNAEPFYNIYGGTQDNNSMGGPAQTNNVAGILNTDWQITNGGDGFESAVDWSNPNVVYAQAQYGWLVRFDKLSGEKVPIQPMPGKDESAYRWNWDAPLLVSPHDPSTIYFAANKVFKSTNRGDDWQIISQDLTQQIDRNKLKIMNQVWTIDAVMKNASTTIYGNIVALDESPKKKGLLFAGTDDGLIQISENDGQNWTKTAAFPGVPANTRVNMLTASIHNENEVFATFNNQRMGDFKPYLMKSSDKGKTWISISGNLPERGTVYCIKQDHIDPNLLFVGTEFGAYFTTDGGKNWTKLSGLPTIAVYDLDIQKRENDIVAATFGRGFYVLDNYAPLRELTKENLDKNAHVFKIKDALLYVQADPLGLEGTGFQGTNLWAAKNPEFGASIYIHLNKEFKTLKSTRQEKEKELEKEKKDVFYPSLEELRQEDLDQAAKLIVLISDEKGQEVRRIHTTASKGTTKIVWNLRGESTNSIDSKSKSNNGFLVKPGKYSVNCLLLQNGKVENLGISQSFEVKMWNNLSVPASDFSILDNFRKEVSEINRKVSETGSKLSKIQGQLDAIENAISNYPGADLKLLEEVRDLELLRNECTLKMWGDRIKSSREFEVEPSLSERLNMLEYKLYENRSGVSNTHRNNKVIVEQEWQILNQKIESIQVRISSLKENLHKAGLPYISE
jgi:photosystem II stability/assembly factor-like uncharacterized protein